MSVSVRFGAVLVCVVLNAGCGALHLVHILAGMAPNRNEIIINESTVMPELRSALTSAKQLVFISSNLSATAAAVYLEQYGGYEVSVEKPPKFATLSRKLKRAKAICSQPEQPDLVFFENTRKSNAGIRTKIGQWLVEWLVGRVNDTTLGKEDVVRCKDKWMSQFSFRVEVDRVYDGVDQSQVLGQEYAKALLRLSGKLPPYAELERQ